MNSFKYWLKNREKKHAHIFTISLIHLRQTFKPCVYICIFYVIAKKKTPKQIACKPRLNGLFHSMFVFANFCDRTNLKYKTKYYHIDAPEKINK